jgi:GNAT superfamily N-acetyltransferase
VEHDGLLRFETPLRALPYTGVIRTAIAGDPDPVIAAVRDAHAARGAGPFCRSRRPVPPPVWRTASPRPAIPELEPVTGMYIDGMSVLPEARGRGIAGALTDILIAQAADLGCRRVVLHSSALAAGSTPAPGSPRAATSRSTPPPRSGPPATDGFARAGPPFRGQVNAGVAAK